MTNLLTRAVWLLRQRRLRARLRPDDLSPGLRTPRLVGGVDVSFVKSSERDACAAVVVLEAATQRVVYEAYERVELTAPYVAGYLAFREAPHLARMLRRLRAAAPHLYPDVVLVDGNGVLHPHGCGLASHLGVLVDTPTIGVGKSLHCVDGLTIAGARAAAAAGCAAFGDSVPLVGASGRTWGAALRSSSGGKGDAPFKPIFVSVGHGVTLATALAVVTACCRHRVPEPVRQADLRSREWLRANPPPHPARPRRLRAACLAALVYLACAAPCAWLVRSALGPEPYMDEVFHVPMAATCCDSAARCRAEWDPKITTFPGYYAAAAAVHALTGGSGCGIGGLRTLSLAAGAATAALLGAHAEAGPGAAALAGALAALYPPHAFASLLAYTDACALLWVAAALRLAGDKPGRDRSLPRQLALCAASSAAVFTRQTNAVWVALVAAQCGLARLETDHAWLTAAPPATAGNVARLLRTVAASAPALAAGEWPLLVPVAAFAYFVVRVNGGQIVVGDAGNHAPALHGAQAYYAAAVVAAVLGADTAARAGRPFLAACARRGAAASAAAAAAAAAVLHRTTLAHPFLLADNRHYTFYAWQRVLRYPAARLGLVPAYAYAAFVVASELTAAASPFWVLLYAGASAAALLPSPLLEPRYFTVPVALAVIRHAKTRAPASLAFGVATSAAVGLAAAAVFARLPFDCVAGCQRFMW